MIGKEDEQTIRAVGGTHASRYGEITPRGLLQLGARLALSPADIFADLGSGLGRACTQAVGDFSVRSAVGVELSSTRHALARAKVSEFLSSHGCAEGRVRLVCADCAGDEVWDPDDGVLRDASVVWMSSALFSEELMNRIGRRLESSESVRAVATLQRFPKGLVGYTRQSRPELCEMSWTAALSNPEAAGSDDAHGGAVVHVYERVAPAAP